MGEISKCYGGVSYDRLGKSCPKCRKGPGDACGYIGVYVGQLEEALKDLLGDLRGREADGEKWNPGLLQLMNRGEAVLKIGGVEVSRCETAEPIYPHKMPF